jgi:hypothetical protein
MVCEKCRYVNKDTALVCKHCGAPFAQDEPQATSGKSAPAQAKSANAGGASLRTTKVSVTSDARADKGIARAVKIDVVSPITNGVAGHDDAPEAGKAAPNTVLSNEHIDTEDIKKKLSVAELETDFGTEGEFEEDGRRGNIKFIALIAAVGVFVVAAIIVLCLLIFSKPGGNAPAAAEPSAAQPTAALTQEPSAAAPTAGDYGSASALPSDAITGG